MSKIDNRVVSMTFDNKQFEAGVQTSMKTLDNLSEKLTLKSAIKSLLGFKKVTNEFSLEGMARGVDAIQNRFSTMGIIGMTVIQEMTRTALNFAKRTTGALVDMISTGGKQRAINIEQAKFQFRGLGMDIEAAMDDALYAVKGTAYGLDAAAKAASQLGASGVALGDDMKGALRGISGVAAMTNSSYDDIAHVFTTVAGQGKVMTMQLRQIENRGVNVAAVMAKSMGTTEAAVREMVTAGKIDFNTFATIMNETFGDHATKANETFTGSLSNVKAALSRMGAAIHGPQLDNMRDVFNSLIPIIDGLVNVFTPFIEQFTNFTTHLKTKLVDAINGINLKTFDEMAKKMGVTEDAFRQMVNAGEIGYSSSFDTIKNFIEGFKNVLLALGSVLKPIGQAFKDIFPPKTIAQLESMSDSFKTFTAGLTLSDKASGNLRSTFKGLFAVLDIVKMGFFRLFEAVFPFAKSGGGTFLEITGNIGEMLVSFRDMVKESVFVEKAFTFLSDVLGGLSKGLTVVVNAIKDAFKALSGADTDGVEKTGSRLERISAPFVFLGKLITNMADVTRKAIDNMSPGFRKFFDTIGKGLTKAKDVIKDFVSNMSFDKGLDALNTGFLGMIALGIKAFITDIGLTLRSGGTIVNNLKTILWETRMSFETIQARLKADILLKIAAAIAILTASVVVLSLIDSAKLTKALGAITVLFADLTVTMALFSTFMKKDGFSGAIKVTGMLLGMGVAILLLSTAVGKLAKIEWQGLVKGLGSVGVLLGMLVITAKSMSKDSGKMMKGATGLIAFAVAINILASAVKKLGGLDVNTLAKGLGSVGILLLELALFMKVTDLDGMGLLKGSGLLLLATALVVLASAVRKFGDIPMDQLQVGLGAVGVLLLELALFTKVTGDSKKVMTTAAAMVVLGGALKIFANVIQQMGGMSMTEIAKGLGTMAGALVIIIGAMKLMTTGLAGAAALLIIANALLVISGVLKVLGGMSIGAIAKSLGALAGVFVVLGGAALILGPLIPVLLGLSGTLLALSVSVALIGSGIALLGAGFVTLAAAGGAGVAVLLTAVTGLINLIPTLLISIGKGLVGIAEVIGASGAAILAAVTAVLEAFLQGFITVIPLAVEAVVTLMGAIIDGIIKLLPKLIDLGVLIIISILEGIRDVIGKIVEIAIEIVVNFIDGVAGMIGDVIDAGFDLMIAFIEGLANSLEKNTDTVIGALEHLIKALFGAGKRALLATVGGFKETWHKIMQSGFVQGIKDKVQTVVEAIKESPSKGLEAIKTFLSKFKERGGEFLTNLKQGASDKVSDVVDSVKEGPRKAITALGEFISDFKGMGKDLIGGMISGITGKAKDLVESVKGVASSALDGAKRLLGIQSPSTVFRDEVGKQIGAGMAKGITQSESSIVTATTKVGKASFESMKKWVDKQHTYFTLSMGDELSKWKSIQSKYKKGSAERLEIDKKIQDLQMKIKQEAYNKTKDWIDEEKYYKRLSLEDELKTWKGVQKYYAKGTEERKQADRELYRINNELAKKAYDDKIAWMDKERYYNRLTVADEIKTWEEIQKKYKEGTNEREQADRELYRIKRELVEKQKQLDEDYLQHTKRIDEQLKADIKSLNDGYDQAVKDRTRTLANAYGLFDKVAQKKKYPMPGEMLLENLKGQVVAFAEWQASIDSLSSKGINEGLLDELREMGPKSLEQIEALNRLSDSELTEYSNLWATKHAMAKNQAIGELAGLKNETQEKINDLKAQAVVELEGYKKIWIDKSAEIKMGVTEEFMEMNVEVTGTIEELKKETVSEFKNIVDDIQKVVTTKNWKSIGLHITQGITEGINAGRSSVLNAMVSVAVSALQASQKALGIKSPSKEFEKIGRFSVMGLAGGLKRYTKYAVDEAKTLGETTIDAVNSIIDSNWDLNPVIRPVIDLSDMDKMIFDSELSVNTSLRKATGISTASEKTLAESTGVVKEISFVQNNHSPKALSRVEIYRQTKNQISKMKGVLDSI